MSGRTFGGELVGDWRPVPRLRLTLSYAHFQSRLRLDPKSADPWSLNDARSSPRHQASLRSSLDLSRRVSVDMLLYYTSAWRQNEVDAIDAIGRVDARIGWNPTRRLELSATVQNAFNDRIYETRTDLISARARIERNLYVKAAFAF
jgi:iron complex outermembrane receptor protein